MGSVDMHTYSDAYPSLPVVVCEVMLSSKEIGAFTLFLVSVCSHSLAVYGPSQGLHSLALTPPPLNIHM